MAGNSEFLDDNLVDNGLITEEVCITEQFDSNVMTSLTNSSNPSTTEEVIYTSPLDADMITEEVIQDQPMIADTTLENLVQNTVIEDNHFMESQSGMVILDQSAVGSSQSAEDLLSTDDLIQPVDSSGQLLLDQQVVTDGIVSTNESLIGDNVVNQTLSSSILSDQSLTAISQPVADQHVITEQMIPIDQIASQEIVCSSAPDSFVTSLNEQVVSNVSQQPTIQNAFVSNPSGFQNVIIKSEPVTSIANVGNSERFQNIVIKSEPSTVNASLGNQTGFRNVVIKSDSASFGNQLAGRKISISPQTAINISAMRAQGNSPTILRTGSTGSSIILKNPQQQNIRYILKKNPSSPLKIKVGQNPNQQAAYVVNSSEKKQAINYSINNQNYHLPVYSFNEASQLSSGGRKKIIVLNNVKLPKQEDSNAPSPIPKIVRKKKEEDEIPEFLSEELKHAYRIVKELVSDKVKSVNWPFLEAVSSNWPEVEDYKEVIKNPMWLLKIKKNLFEKKYESIKEPIADLRLVFENCYRYNGPDHPISKKAIKLETIMEQKLALLSKDLREKTRIELNSDELEDDPSGGKRSAYRTLADGGKSIILNRVKHERELREKELKRKQMEEKKAEKEAAYQKMLEWENTLMNDDFILEMKAMWEFPQIGHFLYLTQSTLNIPEISQFELERFLLMPRQSIMLPAIMTSLLANPNARANLDKKPPMKYKIWHEKLKMRVMKWYKLLKAKYNQPLAVFEQMGIEPTFFAIMGLDNPLEVKQFHELTFHQRIWMMKSLCDYCLHTHKKIQEIIAEQSVFEQREVILGCDMNGYVYIHFPQFCGQDLRIYKQAGWIPPSIDVPVVNIRGRSKAPITRVVRKPPEPVIKKVDSPVSNDLYQRPSNLRQSLKPVKREDMICDDVPSSRYQDQGEANAYDDEDPNYEAENLSEAERTLDVDSVDSNEISISENSSPLCTDNMESPKPDKSKAKPKSEARPESPVIQADLSNSIMDFDLEKELAISIRGRCGRKQTDKKKSKKSKKDGNTESDYVEDGENKDIENKEDDDEAKKEDDSLAEVSIKTENESEPEMEEKKIEVEEIEPDEINDIDQFELNVYDYLSGGEYQKPNLKNFELIVDSMESLEKLVDSLLKEEDLPKRDPDREKVRGRPKAPKLTRAQKNELELKKRLLNLLDELEPWKEKLASAVKKTLLKLKKEWDDYDPKSEEVTENSQDVWDCDSDDEKPELDFPKSACGDEDLNVEEGDDLAQRLKMRHMKVMKRKEKEKAEEQQKEEAAMAMSSRGRLRRVRNYKDDIYVYGDDGEASNEKDSDKSDTFKPEISKRRARREALALNEKLTPKKNATDIDESREVYAICDGVLKRISISSLGGKQIIRKKDPSLESNKKLKLDEQSASPNGIPEGKVVKIGNQTVVIPNNGSTDTQVISVGGKTVLVQRSDQRSNQVNQKIAPNADVVQLHAANGNILKTIPLAEAQKLLAQSKKSPISSEKGVISNQDGSIMVPVVDGQGKVCYLKMKKNAAAGGASKVPSPVKKAPEASQQSNILSSIIQSSIGDLNNVQTNSASKPTLLKNVLTSPVSSLTNNKQVEKDLLKIVSPQRKTFYVRVPKSISGNSSALQQFVTNAASSGQLLSNIKQSIISPKVVSATPNQQPQMQKVLIPQQTVKKPAANVTQKELTDAVTALQDETFVESESVEEEPNNISQTDQLSLLAHELENNSTCASATTEAANAATPKSNKTMKVMINKGGQMIPVSMNSEQLSGLTRGGSYVLNLKSGKLVPVSSSNSPK